MATKKKSHLEWWHLVLAALMQRKIAVQMVLDADGAHLEKLQDVIDLATAQQVAIKYVDRRELDAMAHGATHGGVLAIVSPKPRTTPDQLFEFVEKAQSPPLLLLLEGIDDARNLGFVLRTAEATGALAVLIKKHLWDLDPIEIAHKASGVYDCLPFVQIDDFEPLRLLQLRCLRLLGCIAAARAILFDADLKAPTILAIGGEKRGLSGAVRSICDGFITIPTLGDATSLSLSHAAAIVLGEAMRQRHTKKK
jgi:23S rRNA (guanosine2251-2'-O)-methyltransferase